MLDMVDAFRMASSIEDMNDMRTIKHALKQQENIIAIKETAAMLDKGYGLGANVTCLIKTRNGDFQGPVEGIVVGISPQGFVVDVTSDEVSGRWLVKRENIDLL